LEDQRLEDEAVAQALAAAQQEAEKLRNKKLMLLLLQMN
jgi:hypothetical protein